MDINNRIHTAHQQFLSWRNTSFEERQKRILHLSKLLKDRAEDYGKIISSEMNKPIAQAIAEVEKSAVMAEYYAHCENILMPEKIPSEFSISEIHFVPKGVILGVMPWNFPFWQVLRFAIPTILAGNTILLKHASICFGSGNAIEKLFSDAGFPVGVFQNLEVGHQAVEEILKNPLVQGVSLTGSEKAGAKVAALAGEHIKKSLLELGGSDAFIVLEDADLNEAAKVGTLSRLQNCGQTCIAAKRFIVLEKIYDEFISKLKAEFQEFIPNNPMDKATKIGGMARKDLADELENQYHKAVENGAEIILPLKRISEIAFVPALLSVQENNPILREEIFGPVGIVMKAKDDTEALRIANNIPFGLANSVWTADKNRADFFIKNLDSGTISINKMTSSDPRFPFGGTKMSGYGVELSQYALKEFVNLKTILMK